MGDTDLVIQGGALPTFLLERLVSATSAASVTPTGAQVFRLKGARRPADFSQSLAPLIEAERLDWAFMPSALKLTDFGLIGFDMDSTLITIECIDELADFAGKKNEVAAVTDAAMHGQIDYRESLGRRLALLAGLDARVLAQVYAERLLLSPGARELLATVQQAGLHTAILSGGFTYFTERLRIELGFDFATSNELEITGGKLTGRVSGAVIDAEAKADSLRELAGRFGLRREQLIAVGDGANDLPMLRAAGLSIAYHAKPSIQQQADVAINFCGLDAIGNLFAAGS